MTVGTTTELVHHHLWTRRCYQTGRQFTARFNPHLEGCHGCHQTPPRRTISVAARTVSLAGTSDARPPKSQPVELTITRMTAHRPDATPVKASDNVKDLRSTNSTGDTPTDYARQERPPPLRDNPIEEFVSKHDSTRHAKRARDSRPWPVLNRWSCRESNPGPTAFPRGFSVRSPLCLYLDLSVTQTSRDDDPSRCLMSPYVPRPDV